MKNWYYRGYDGSAKIMNVTNSMYRYRADLSTHVHGFELRYKLDNVLIYFRKSVTIDGGLQMGWANYELKRENGKTLERGMLVSFHKMLSK